MGLKSSKFASLNEEQEDESIEKISVTDVPDEEEFIPIDNSEEQENDDTNAVGTEDQNDVDDQEKETESKHNPGSISCDLCSKQIQRKNLRRHMKTVHQSMEDREDLVTLDMEEDQKCRICCAKFAVLDKLKEHVKDVHDIDYDNLESCEVQDEIPVEDLTAETIEAEDTIKEFKCDQCEASYHLKDSLRRHKRKKH